MNVLTLLGGTTARLGFPAIEAGELTITFSLSNSIKERRVVLSILRQENCRNPAITRQLLLNFEVK